VPVVGIRAVFAEQCRKGTPVATKAELKAMADALLAEAAPKRSTKKAIDGTAPAMNKPAAKKTAAKKTAAKTVATATQDVDAVAGTPPTAKKVATARTAAKKTTTATAAAAEVLSAVPDTGVPAVKKTAARKNSAKSAAAVSDAESAVVDALDSVEGVTKAPAAKKTVAKKTAKSDDAKPAAKRGRKPKDKGDALDDDADLSDIEADLELEAEPEEQVVAAEGTEKVKPLRMKISKAKERALMKEFGLDETVLTEEEMNTRRQRLKLLIKLGKTRGYLTHAEINDHLPDKLVDAETLEVVIAMLSDMGVAVYEQTPDAETLLLNNTGQSATTEEEAEEEAEAALSTVDSEFGRTTDPVRMYMREMGTVELLTREGEIEIAKRIEGGLMDMMDAISASPTTIHEILSMAEQIREGKVVINTIVDGFTDVDENDDYVAEEDQDEYDDDDDDDGKGGSKAMTRLLEKLKVEALERFDRMRDLFDKMHKVYDKEGYGTPAYMKIQHTIS